MSGRQASAVAAASGAPNYGSMDSAGGQRESLQQVQATSEKAPAQSRISPGQSPANEPPRPAVRRKIQEKMSTDTNKSHSSERQYQKSSIEPGKRPSGALPLPNHLAQSVPTSKRIDNPDKPEASQTSTKHADCQRPYPKHVGLIVANEFCERFSHYGMRTVLLLYFRSVLDFNDSLATVSFHLFATLCYVTPILGAFLGDSVWGKYKTILYLSLVYFLGELVLLLSSVFWHIGTLSVAATCLGLLLIGVGTGGIKPCVSAFGGDQFHSHETQWRECFFSLFYAAINLGSLISMFLTPMLRTRFQCVNRSDCYPLAFGVPCAIMFAAIVLFVAAHRHYYMAPLPRTNITLDFVCCVGLALKRKLGLKKSPSTAPSAAAATAPVAHDIRSDAPKRRATKDRTLKGPVLSADNTSSSSLSAAGAPDEQRLVSDLKSTSKTLQPLEVAASENPLVAITPSSSSQTLSESSPNSKLDERVTSDENHWLYLASDRFDKQSIEDFRCVLGIMLLFLPTPVYWCLFDQQSSLWTLQAVRMDGRVPGTSFVLEPDQMNVANPLLLLLCIGLFQLVVYPGLNRFGLLQSSIKRMTAGGLIAAGAYVASALIELHLQSSLPPIAPPAGYSSLVMVNGLDDCALVEPTLAYVQIPIDLGHLAPAAQMEAFALSTNNLTSELKLPNLEPLNSQRFSLLAAPSSSGQQAGESSPGAAAASQALNNYQLRFRLANSNSQQPQQQLPTNQTLASYGLQMCPFDSSQLVELSVALLPERNTRLLYVQQGNGKLAYKLFNDSMSLPQAGKAKVRLLFEYFGSSAQAIQRQFSLLSEQQQQQQQSLLGSNSSSFGAFNFTTHEGQVLLSDYMDIEVPSTRGARFKLVLPGDATNSSGIKIEPKLGDNTVQIHLEPGTRNLIIVQQRSSKVFEFKHELLQDNSYRASMLLQLVPYLLISISEVLFSITGLEFSYAMAPESMKSLILGAWLLTTALGNLLIVAVESVQPFANLAHKILFYAAMMLVAMIAFAIIGYFYKPYKKRDSLSQ